MRKALCAYPAQRTLITAAVFVAVILAFALALPGRTAQAAASADVCPPNKTAAECATGGLGQTAKTAGLGTTSRSLPDIIGTIIYAALSLTGIFFVCLMIYGGFVWMQARGNAEDVTKAQKIIESAVIGIVVIGLAFAITNFVLSRIIESTGTADSGGTTLPASGGSTS